MRPKIKEFDTTFKRKGLRCYRTLETYSNSHPPEHTRTDHQQSQGQYRTLKKFTCFSLKLVSKVDVD